MYDALLIHPTLAYSRMMDGLHKAGIEVDRKMLAELAVFNKDAFAKLAEQAKAAVAVTV